MRSAIPNLWIAATVSPPPAIENAGDAAMASASALVPRGEGVELEHADRPVPDDRAGLGDDHLQRRDRARADVEDHVVRLEVLDRLERRRRRRRELLRADGVDRDRHLARERVQDRLRFADEVGLDQRLADVAVRRQDERVGDAAADDQRVDLGGERLQHRELGRDLRSADDRDERPRRVRERLAERVELGRHQRAGAGDRRVLRDAVRRRLGAVRGAERVVDVDVAEPRHLPRERVVVLLLARVEAAVLEQHHGARLRARHATRRRRPSRGRAAPACRAARTAASRSARASPLRSTALRSAGRGARSPSPRRRARARRGFRAPMRGSASRR